MKILCAIPAITGFALAVLIHSSESVGVTGCGSSANGSYLCAGYPTGCLDNSTCDIAFSALRSRLDGFYYQINLASTSKGYVSVALASALTMGYDLTFDCIHINDTVEVLTGHNKYHNHSRFGSEYQTADIVSQSGNYSDGTLSCQAMIYGILIGYNDTLYDLAEKAWYLQLAIGNEVKADTNLEKHYLWVRSSDIVKLSHKGTVKLSNAAANTTGVGVKGCGSRASLNDSYLCAGYPSGCLDDSSCKIALSAMKYAGKEYYDINMASTSKGYVSVALAKELTMGEDVTLDCIYLDDEVKLYTGLNGDHSHVRLSSAWQGAIISQNGTYADGKLSCEAKILTKFRGPNNISYDLNNETWYLQLAIGNTIQSYTTNLEKHYLWVRTSEKVATDYEGTIELGQSDAVGHTASIATILITALSSIIRHLQR